MSSSDIPNLWVPLALLGLIIVAAVFSAAAVDGIATRIWAKVSVISDVVKVLLRNPNASPCNANASQYNFNASPCNANASQYNVNASPCNANASQYNVNASQYNVNASPCNTNASQYNCFAIADFHSALGQFF